MDAKKVLSVLDTYIQLFEKLTDFGEPLSPTRADPTRKYYNNSGEQLKKVNHVWWACEQAKTYVNEGRMEKAFRWLGFIQGALWMLGLYSIEEMANHNKPPEEPVNLDPNRKSE